MSAGKGDSPRKVNGAKYRRNYEAIFRKKGKRGPFGCKCQSLRERVVGDGCDICNRKLAEEIERDNAAQLEEDRREASAQRMRDIRP